MNIIVRQSRQSGVVRATPFCLLSYFAIAGSSPYTPLSLIERSLDGSEYSCAVTPQVRQTGKRLSGLAGTAYASLLT